MKKILVLNSGSSSLKYQLFEIDGSAFKVLAKGLAERIGIADSILNFQVMGQDKQVFNIDLPNHDVTLQEIFKLLLGSVLHSMDELDAVGHRLGHGGEYFDKSALIDQEVMQKIYEAKDLLPLHGAAFILGIEAVSKLLPNIKQVATFDTAFHQTMPKEAYLYAIPTELYEKHKIRRYGFHGTSHQFVSRELKKICPLARKVISCHLGSGASICAIKDGKSIDTSLGFTATTGVVMGTRCGDIDAYIPLYLMKTLNMSWDDVNMMMNKQSGLFALSGGYSDSRDVEKLYFAGDEKAKTAVEVWVHNVVKYIGAYAAEMDGLDAVIFTAGIGENSCFLRQKVCERLSFLGIKLDEQANLARGELKEISAADSRVKVFVIPTNEELVIAEDTYNLTA